MLRIQLFILSVLLFLTEGDLLSQPSPSHNLVFDSLATRWDEGIPLGNGWLGALIWKKDNHIRLSLDRVDLWDDRPMPQIDKLRFNWIAEQVKKKDYDTVQKLGDEPYEKYPAPTKIPGAALEFDLSTLGRVKSNVLDIKNGVNTIEFENGGRFRTYIHATRQVGYISFENAVSSVIIPQLIVPAYYTGKSGAAGNSVEGQGLERLGYAKGTITKSHNAIRYHQPTWNGHFYEVLIRWFTLDGNRWIAEWTITNDKKAQLPTLSPAVAEPTGWDTHVKWWNDYWSRSAVSLPDPQLEKQYYLEMYKFACVARANTPAITLQAIWTADNGNLPPWKGDFHHDLNTELSYWPGYTGNHLDLTASYTNWLWHIKAENEKWTKQCFETSGLNVPGVTTISGKPMGGWIQYSVSPTTAAWLAQHFYWQWKYSMDDTFLKEKCYPYFNEIELYLSQMLNREKDTNQKHQLPLSSSPEYFDNSIYAWFTSFTNYDLALVKNFYEEGTDVSAAAYSRRPTEWIEEQRMLPDFTVNETGLAVAPGQNLDVSHRHMSPYMAIYPLCLLDIENPADKEIIERSIHHIEEKGTRGWVGYSFSWMACIYARAKQADNAVRQLKIFAGNFCSPNSFHLNGDQKGGEYSAATYRPFTLEGNFAFAQAVHELLIQTRNAVIEVFPAVPESWKNIAFHTLRTEGAFLVSAVKKNAVVSEVKVTAEKGGELLLKLPFKTWLVDGVERKDVRIENGIAAVHTQKGQTIIFKNAYE